MESFGDVVADNLWAGFARGFSAVSAPGQKCLRKSVLTYSLIAACSNCISCRPVELLPELDNVDGDERGSRVGLLSRLLCI